MYTQCPQCEAAFRITVDVLQQARGQVRCGSCDHAFNALDHLSEEPPAVPPNEPEHNGDDEDLERSQLLETLDRLAGTEDVRIEDTGVEWRVVDDDDAQEDELDAQADASSPEAAAATDGAENSSIRWILEDADEPFEDEDIPDTAETTQNEVLSATFENADVEPANDDEPRYDDNTLLPDDFEEQHQYSAPTPQRRATDHFEFVVEDETAPQTDLELSEPEDWTDLLEDLAPSDVADAEAEADAAAIDGPEPTVEATAEAVEASAEETPPPAVEPDAVADDGDSGEPTGPDPDREEEIAMVASQLDDLLDTMGTKPVQALADSMDENIDIGEGPSPAQEPPDDASSAQSSDDEAAADVLAEEAIDELIDESLGDPIEEPTEQVAASTGDSMEESIEEQIEAAIDDIVDEAAEAAEHPVPYAGVGAPGNEPDEAAAHADPDQAVEAAAEAELAAPQYDDDELELDSSDVPDFVDVDSAVGESPLEDAAAELAADDDPAEDPSHADDGLSFDDSADESETSEADTLAQTPGEWRQEDEATETPAGLDSDADTDEELADLAAMTGNMPIDADMLRAMRDSDFAATMTNEDGSPMIETIVMEGDQVSDSLAERELTGRLETLTDPASFIDTYITKKTGDNAGDKRAGKRAIALAAGLLLLLVAQFVHHARESLATIGAFNQTIGPLYRMLGDPITPNWDIKGWQFEATNGSTDESDSVLTIYSRLSNRAEDALPYPIVHVALTDRFEEVIGSRMLEPSEYLAGNADPERSVPAGANFTAVITIASPADEATGFKLNVCYPAGGGQLRCAIEDFKTP